MKAKELIEQLDQVDELSSWQETAKEELEKELDVETEVVSKDRDRISLKAYGKGSNGESEWDVFKDYTSAEKKALDYVEDMMKDDPTLFNQDFMKNYLFVSKTDRDIVANEEADAYVECLDETEIIDQVGMLSRWRKLEDQKEELEFKLDDLEDKKEISKISKRIEKIKDLQTKIYDKAWEKVHDDYYQDVKKRLDRDPLGYLEDLGYDNPFVVSFVQIDFEGASKAALDAGGLGHFLDSYDGDGLGHFLDNYNGDEIELDSGAIAFGTN